MSLKFNVVHFNCTAFSHLISLYASALAENREIIVEKKPAKPVTNTNEKPLKWQLMANRPKSRWHTKYAEYLNEFHVLDPQKKNVTHPTRV